MNSQRYEKLVEKSLQISHFKIEYENPWSVASDTVLKVEICEQEFPASLRKQQNEHGCITLSKKMPFQLYDYEGVVIFVMVGILLIMVIVLIISRFEGVLKRRVALS